MARVLRMFTALVPVAVLATQLGAVAHAATAPAVSVSVPAPDGDNGWSRTQPTLTISASDPSGVSSIGWTWSGATTGSGKNTLSAPYPTSASATVQPTTPGTSTVTATAAAGSSGVGSGAGTVKWDPDPPSQPANPRWRDVLNNDLTTRSDTTSSSPTATWTTSTDAVSGMRDYRVQLSEVNDFSQVMAERTTTGATMTFSASDGLQAGHSYYFRVGARDQAGNVAWSTTSNRLDYTTQQTGPAVAHAPVLAGYFGEDIPISLEASCGSAHSCSARLFYRPTQLDGPIQPFGGSWTRVDLTQGASETVNNTSAFEWDGTIPGTAVTTSGVDYFLEAEDNFALTQFPGATYVDSGSQGSLQPVAHTYQHVHVVSPPLLVHQPPAYGQSGQALPVTLQATCSTGSCAATLYYRTSVDSALTQPLLATPAWPRAAMQADPSPVVLGSAGQIMTFRATIPAEVVDTRGVDYFFSVSDGTATSWWPGVPAQGYYAPTDGMRTGYQHVHVLETPHIAHLPVTQSPYRAPIAVDATANCASPVCTAKLYYRTTTTSVLDSSAVFASAPMLVTVAGTQGGNQVLAVHGVIPASVADTRGVDYFFSVSDGPTTTWWPGTSSVDGYAPVPGVRVGYQHTRVLDPPHFSDVPPATAPALKDFTVDVPLTCATESCTVTLYYAHSATSLNGPFTALPMNQMGTALDTPLGRLATFRATVPGPEVTTTGLAYYVKAFDGYVTSYSPGTSYWGAYVPLDGTKVGVHPVRVLEPPHLVHDPVVTAYATQPIDIRASSNCATPACTATLHWRTTGHDWQVQTMTSLPPTPGALIGDTWTYDATIPSGDVTTEGVDYWIEVTDGYVRDATATYHVTVQLPTTITHVAVASASPGTDVPIEALVTCSTPTCSATLSYRTTSADPLANPAWTTVPMQQVGDSIAGGQSTTLAKYVATIPAGAVTTAGVDYYLRASDGVTTAYSPGTSYTATQATQIDGMQLHYFTIAVLQPGTTSQTPTTDSIASTVSSGTQVSVTAGPISATASF
jgi:Fibronectin type III domain